MGRKLYYVDSYGKVHRDYKAEKTLKSKDAKSGGSWMRNVLLLLAVFAVLMVLASIIR